MKNPKKIEKKKIKKIEKEKFKKKGKKEKNQEKKKKEFAFSSPGQNMRLLSLPYS